MTKLNDQFHQAPVNLAVRWEYRLKRVFRIAIFTRERCGGSHRPLVRTRTFPPVRATA